MDSIHSRSAASEVETRRHHRRRELVTAVFLNHLGFCNQKKGAVVIDVLRERRTLRREYSLLWY